MKPESHSAPAGHVFNSVREIEVSVKGRMEKAVTDLQHAMATIRTGRASVSLLDHIRVDYYGTPTPLNQLGNLHVPDPTLITVQPWDVSQIGAIEKAIRASDLGLNPANDGKLIRIPVPPLRDQQRLLEAYHRSESAARELLAESETAALRARNIESGARKRLVDDLGKPWGRYRCASTSLVGSR